MGQLGQDLRYALRSMRKQPFFALIAVVTLGLGIGANTAIFSVVHAVLLEAVPYPAGAPERVLFLTETSPQGEEISVSYPSFKDWQELNRSFSSMVGTQSRNYNLLGLEEPSRLDVMHVSHGYFDMLGVRPALGRFPVQAEDTAGGEKVLVLNHELWRGRFGSDPNVVGTTVRLDDAPYLVVGVLPADFELSPEERAFSTLEQANESQSARNRGNHQGIRVLARLRDGVSVEDARAEMVTLAAQLETEYPDTNTGVSVKTSRLVDERVQEYEGTLWTLLGAVSLVLLIACVNVANLLLARSVGRTRVTAIQAALGASRLRLVRQGLTEGIVLAVLGGAFGALIAFGGLSALVALMPSGVPRLGEVELDLPVLAYSLALSVLTGLLFGSVPAWFAARSNPSDPLKEGGRQTGSGRAGRGLLVAEVALATMLLIGAGLLIRTVQALTRVDPGFRSDRLLTLQVGVPYSRYDDEARAQFLRVLEETVRGVPGVVEAALGNNLPMLGSSWGSIFIVDDRPVPPRGELPGSMFTPVAPGYFETFEIPLIRGRLFEPSDRADAPDVVVINEKLAEALWPNENPIGKRLKQGWPESEGDFFPWREIVGVVGNVKQFGLGAEISNQTYIPAEQAEIWDVQFGIRTATEPSSVVEPVKRAVHALDADLPVFGIKTMEDVLEGSMAPRRFTMILLGLFAALALVLAAVGLYGVIAYSVARRTREIGLRMSVGADRADVFRLVVRQGMGFALLGAAIGLAAALGASRVLESVLFGVESRDPLTFIVVPIVLLTVAFVAVATPAFAATRIDPIRALRYE